MMRFIGLMLVIAWEGQAQVSPAIRKITLQNDQLGTVLKEFKSPPPSEWPQRAEQMTMIGGNFVWTGMNANGTQIWDLRNPLTPVLVNEIPFNRNVHTLNIMGDYLFNYGNVLDFSDPKNVKVVVDNWWLPWGSPWQHLQYPYMYSAYNYGDWGVALADYRDLANPKKVKMLELNQQLGFTAGALHVIGNLMIVTSGDEHAGVSTWDIGDPLNPKLMDSRKDGRKMYFSYVYGSKLITAGPVFDGEYSIFDFSDPYDIKLEWEGRLPGGRDYVTFQNGFMFSGTHKEVRDSATQKPFLGKVTEGIRLREDWVPRQDRGNWIKVDMKTMKTVFVGEGRFNPYAQPIGNLVWIGFQGVAKDGRASLSAHQAEPDGFGPSLLYVNPQDKALRQPLTSRVGLVFDEDLDHRTLTADNITVRPVGGAALDGWYSLLTTMVNFAPKEPLKPNTTYEIVIRPGGVQDWSGNRTDRIFYSRFSTGADLADATLSIKPAKSRPSPLGFLSPVSPYSLPGFPGLDAKGRWLPVTPSRKDMAREAR